ncbi:hypothetical protein B0J15DRAFT_549673 [Fusarium solani]|uniref:Endonuclease/exonuclease/phosphatase domain-containing protein n=1 Tax=Fusarium solani TaxID=169388 RepID=A0A9P9H8H1_FUSSL|nr:uncharacterized protein B0J15DRAFT_549673 [Fusarium solani]KAH7252931.1 hypothetical protein B0J15DRAFT_549673 [Fusarium solani]
MDINGVLEDVDIGDQDAAGTEDRTGHFKHFVVYQANVKNSKLRVQGLLGNVRSLRHAPDVPPDALPWTSTAPYLKCLLVGDFNLHYQLWNGDKTFGDVAKVNDLAEGLQGAGMECLTVPGTATFSRSVSTEHQSSTIDLTFISNHIADGSIDWGLVEMKEFASDHHVIQTTLNMEPGRHNPLRRLWKKTKPKAFVKAAEPRLAPGQPPVLENAQQTDEYIQKINSALFSAINGCIDTVPRFRPRFQRAPDEELVRLDNQWHRVYTCEGGYKVAKLGKKLAQPQESAQSPALTLDGKTYRTDEEKELILRETTGHDDSSNPPTPPLQQPNTVSDRSSPKHGHSPDPSSVPPEPTHPASSGSSPGGHGGPNVCKEDVA